MTSARQDVRATILPPLKLVEHFCPHCGMFALRTNAEPGTVIRLRCTSKGCKGRIREITVGDAQATRLTR